VAVDSEHPFPRALEAFNQGDTEAMVADCDPAVEWHVPGVMPDAQVYRGPEGVKSWAATMREAFDDLRLDPGEFTDLGNDQVLVAIRSTGRGKESGVEVEASFFMLGTGREGKLIRMEFFPTEEAARAAVRDRVI
jgi:ketosteroid isomerase-like protein